MSTPGTPLGGLGVGGALLGPLFPLLWARQGAVFQLLGEGLCFTGMVLLHICIAVGFMNLIPAL